MNKDYYYIIIIIIGATADQLLETQLLTLLKAKSFKEIDLI